MKISLIEHSLGHTKENESLDYENLCKFTSYEIAIMKNDIAKIYDQLEIITLFEIFIISQMLDKISFYIPTGHFNISKYSDDLLESIK